MRDTSPPAAPAMPAFDAAFRTTLDELFACRRDVRRFRTEPLPDGTIEALVAAGRFAPSVGYSQPARYVRIGSAERRAAVVAEFERANAEALAAYSGERAARYASLKLAGLREAPEHLAVFADEGTDRGGRLGRASMPEMLAYSVVCGVHTLWLAARAAGIGVGWVSILDPERVVAIADVPATWRLVAYLCVGYPQEEHRDRELVRAGWETDDARASAIIER